MLSDRRLSASVRPLAVPALVGTILVPPLAVLEVLAAGRAGAGFPVALFAALWLLALACAAVARRVVRQLHDRDAAAGGARLLLMLSVVVLLAGIWSRIVLDQLPCFLGAPNCD